MPVLSFGIGLAWAVRPLNFLEDASEAFAFCRMDGFYEAQSAGKVSLESWVPLPVLAFWAALNAVVENGFEAVEVGADDVDTLIGDQSSQVLTHALTHDAGFAAKPSSRRMAAAWVAKCWICAANRASPEKARSSA